MNRIARLFSSLLPVLSLCAMPGVGRGEAGDAADWRTKMAAIVPQGYLCHRAAAPLVVDGKMDEAAWADAEWTSDFTDIQGSAQPKPRFRTRVKMLWDENYLYIAAEMEEPHVWATLKEHDSVICEEPDFEVFLDPKGETQPYYEFEMNALNTTWDLRLSKPYSDQGKPNNSWEIPGAKTAVQVNGTLNNPADKDRGWTVEIAFPWKALAQEVRHPGAPTEGEQWRLNFSRVEWLIDPATEKKIPNEREDNWVWSPQGAVDMHRPEMWGLVQFTSKPAAEKVAVTLIPGKSARDLAFEVYYAQRDFWKANNRYATKLDELGLGSKTLPSDVKTPELQPTDDGYICNVSFEDAGKVRTWRIRQDRRLKLDEPMPSETEAFISAAEQRFGDPGRRAAYFIVDNMPARDRATLGSDFLMENLLYTVKARLTFPWTAKVPERIFFNDVMPYASLDEPRDPWRAQFFSIAGEIVKDCQTPTEAAQALNREFFKKIDVHYNTGRKRNNQSPAESIAQHKATCTGLSIILVDACRAVGVPARIVGVPQWAGKEGNHTWVEIWDGDWHFLGADEYDAAGLDRGWFKGDAAQTARSSDPIHQIYAASWRRTGENFILGWDPESKEVPGVNVSARYAALAPSTDGKAAIIHLRLREKKDGERLAATVEMRAAEGRLLATDKARAGTADMNDMPAFTMPEKAASVIFRFVREGEARETVVPGVAAPGARTLDFVWSELTPVPKELLEAEAWLAKPVAERGAAPASAFSYASAPRIVALAWDDVAKTRAESAKAEIAAQKIVIGDKTLKWVEKTFGDAPDGKHSLWITLHGGGEGTEEQNDANWRGYLNRYEFPPGAINIAPRAPGNAWDLWFIPCVDDLFDRLIADLVMERGVDPNRVYVIGYSAGGDGVYQLAPRYADRLAAATMCAGHPNDTTPEGLRNLPFFLYMGGADEAFHRNTVVREFSAKMDVLQAADPAGYMHRLTVYPGLPHSMQNREAEAIPRMAPLVRSTWPKRVVWKQGNVTHPRFYWLQRPIADVKAHEIYAAHVDGQTITIEAPASGKLTLRLSDELLDLDKPIRVLADGKPVFEGKVTRSLAAVVQSLQEREDRDLAATALLPVAW